MSFSSLDSILDFIEPINKFIISDDEGYHQQQIGNCILAYEEDFPSIENADIILLGCNEFRGIAGKPPDLKPADLIRKSFYRFYWWHSDIKIADAGNLKSGATLKDTYAALQTVVDELLHHGKRVVILGGSHDLTLAQYQVYANRQEIIEASCIDAKIDINMESPFPADKFLMQMLTDEPNFVKHYNHIGFQSYLVHPGLLETIDKLRFDCYRVGLAKENMEEMEPVIRSSKLVSFDISSIQNAYAPANHLSPNGFTGEEACMLMQYTGMSTHVNTIGIYGYHPDSDVNELTAKQISQMLWYLIDGIYKSLNEVSFKENESFNEFKLAFSEVETSFRQSKKTGRWWMEIPDGSFIACSYKDYLTASENEIPERWMRAVERS